MLQSDGGSTLDKVMTFEPRIDFAVSAINFLSQVQSACQYETRYKRVIRYLKGTVLIEII